MPNLTGRFKQILSEFRDLYVKWKHELAQKSVTDIVEMILHDTGYKQMLNAEQTVEAETRLENLNEFLTVTKQFDQGKKIRVWIYS